MLFRPPKPVSMTLNLAPMVDVMMCLIIFFLLASRLVDAQLRPVDLADSRAADFLDRPQPKSRIVVNVHPAAATADAPADPAGGDVYVISGLWDGKQVTERTFTPGDLYPYLAERAARGRDIGEETQCVIRADQRVRYAAIEAALRACCRAGIAKISFSVSGTRAGEAL